MGTIEGFQPSFDKAPSQGGAKAALTLYGTTTSPYARKVRILARAAALEVRFVDTRTDAGAGALAAVAPLGKVPVLQISGPTRLVLPDSGLIAAWLWSERGPSLRAAGFSSAEGDAAWAAGALRIVVEGALDAAINRFYLLKDKLPDEGYVTRQRDRVLTTLDWLDARMPPFARPVTPAALSLGCALDWMAFRAVVDLPRFPRLAAFRAAWKASDIAAGTEPA